MPPELTLRDYFAGQIVGHLAEAAIANITGREVITDEMDKWVDKTLAESAYELADAMMVAREQQKPPVKTAA